MAHDDGRLRFQLGAGALLGVAAFVVAVTVAGGAFNHSPAARGNATIAVLVAIQAVLVAVVAEIVARRWLFALVERVALRLRAPPIAAAAWAIVVPAALEGAVIGREAVAGAGVFVMGCGYAIVYLAAGRNLAAPLAMHAAFELANVGAIWARLV